MLIHQIYGNIEQQQKQQHQLLQAACYSRPIINFNVLDKCTQNFFCYSDINVEPIPAWLCCLGVFMVSFCRMLNWVTSILLGLSALLKTLSERVKRIILPVLSWFLPAAWWGAEQGLSKSFPVLGWDEIVDDGVDGGVEIEKHSGDVHQIFIRNVEIFLRYPMKPRKFMLNFFAYFRWRILKLSISRSEDRPRKVKVVISWQLKE